MLGLIAALAPINGRPLWQATPRHRSITVVGMIVAVGWMGSVRGLLGPSASHGEILGVFIVGLAPIVVLTALALVFIGGRPRDERPVVLGISGAVASPTKPPSWNARWLRRRRSATYDPRVAYVMLPLWGLAELLRVCGVDDGVAVIIAAAVGLIGAAIYFLRPRRIRSAAQSYVRWRIRRGTWNG